MVMLAAHEDVFKVLVRKYWSIKKRGQLPVFDWDTIVKLMNKRCKGVTYAVTQLKDKKRTLSFSTASDAWDFATKKEVEAADGKWREPTRKNHHEKHIENHKGQTPAMKFRAENEDKSRFNVEDAKYRAENEDKSRHTVDKDLREGAKVGPRAVTPRGCWV